MVVADLHVHTTNSDGTLPLKRIPGVARESGLEAVALTDHDRLHPDLHSPVVERDGVTLIHGIELRVETPSQRVDLLGYGVRPTDELSAECERIQRDRVERGRRMIECVEDRLNTVLPIESRPGLGRPHIARAIAEVSQYDVRDAFDRFIGNDGPCYVARDVPTFERGRDLLGDACDLVGLAHPLRYQDLDDALALCRSLDAVERWYDYGDPIAHSRTERSYVERAIERYNLVPTGGSDAHGRSIGDAGLDAVAYENVRSHLDV